MWGEAMRRVEEKVLTASSQGADGGIAISLAVQRGRPSRGMISWLAFPLYYQDAAMRRQEIGRRRARDTATNDGKVVNIGQRIGLNQIKPGCYSITSMSAGIRSTG